MDSKHYLGNQKWERFRRTGSVEAYLEYKRSTAEKDAKNHSPIQ